MKYLLTILCVALLPQITAAAGFEGCNKDETAVAQTALRNAKDLALKAATAVGDTPEYARWFGPHDPGHAESVRANLKAIVSAIRSGGVTVQCDLVADGGCSAGEYAWVYPGEPYLMHFCPPFFGLPTMVGLEPGVRSSDNGTREGTVIHELSHFRIVADTKDHCYSRRDCSDMASTDQRRAVDNADSYQYYTEDVTYYARQPLANKPPPAPRPTRNGN